MVKKAVFPITGRMEKVALDYRIPDWFLDDFAGRGA
jgi:hypothetical protein